MAIAVGSVSNTPLHGSRTNTTITAPTGITNGDLLVAVLFVGHASALPLLTVTPPAGWTEEANSPSGIDDTDPYEVSVRVYHKVASGESGDYTFTHAAAETQGYMYRLTGADTSNPIDATPVATQYTSPNGQTTTYGSVTTVTNGCFLIFCEADWDGPGSGTVSGTTPSIALRRAGTVTWLGDGTQTTAGATGSRTRTNGNGSVFGRWASLVVPIRPAGAGGSTTNKTVDVTCSVTVGSVKQARKIVSATAAVTVAAVKRANKTIAVTAAATVAAIKQARKIVNVTPSIVVAAVKQTSKTVSVNAAATVAAVKRANKTVAVAASVAVAAIASRAYLKTVNVTVGTAVNVSRQARKIVNVSAAATVGVRRAVSLAISVNVSASVAVRKSVSKTVSVAVAILAALTTSGGVAFQMTRRVIKALAEIRTLIAPHENRTIKPGAEDRTIKPGAENRRIVSNGD